MSGARCASEVVDLALGGDETCRRLIRQAGEAGGRGLGLIGSVFNPPLVIVNGRLGDGRRHC